MLSETVVSISEHKKNPMVTVAAGEGMAVAVLNRNEPAIYCVPARAYRELKNLELHRESARLVDLLDDHDIAWNGSDPCARWGRAAMLAWQERPSALKGPSPRSEQSMQNSGTRLDELQNLGSDSGQFSLTIQSG